LSRALATGALVVAVAACATSGPWIDPTGYDDTADAQRIREQISFARFQHNRSAAQPFLVAQENLEHARRRITEGRDPDAALEHSIGAAADESERTVRWYRVDVERLEELTIPAAFLIPQQLNVAIAIVRRPPEQHPRYLVLFATSSIDNIEGRHPFY